MSDRASARPYTAVPWIEVGNGALSGALVLVAGFGARSGPWWAAAAGAVAWVGWRLAFGTDASLGDAFGDVRGMDAAAVAGVIAACERDAAVLRSNAARLPGEAAALRAEVDGILETFHKRPAMVAKGRRFVEVYLDGVATAVGKYARLVDVGGASAGATANMAALLATATATAANQRAALKADDELDLDLDIQVLRSRMDMEAPIPASPGK